ncbi:uncharacterized protein E0L32_005679 [Thyridium curvatum]|uniref:CCHC-type domain-containing protein n=1 Tax=Thyridium curvatum TaxID=1093900 RepID=A0A507B9A8_9PEZI|nr:uncharacterized protein E0L32_005679 [Thyridium curvatum]TPX13979.1 hypothetical protein E0L32_005679 [Thyridium curvatum]
MSSSSSTIAAVETSDIGVTHVEAAQTSALDPLQAGLDPAQAGFEVDEVDEEQEHALIQKKMREEFFRNATAGPGDRQYHAEPCRTYVSIDGAAITTPVKERAAILTGPKGTESLDAKVHLVYLPFDHSYLLVTFSVLHRQFDNPQVAEVKIYLAEVAVADDNTPLFELRKAESQAEASEMMCKFTPNVNVGVDSWSRIYTLTLTAKLYLNYQELVHRKLRLPDDHVLPKILGAMLPYKDPYMAAEYFEHSPNQRVMFLDRVPRLSSEPAIKDTRTLPAVSQYVDSCHLLVRQMIGTVFDHDISTAYENDIGSISLKAIALPCQHVIKDRRFFLVVNPEGNESILPRDGEAFKVQIMDIEMKSPEASSQDVEKLAEDYLEDVIVPARAEPDPKASILQGSGRFFQDLTEGEATALLPTKAEMADNYAYRQRIIVWCLENRERLVSLQEVPIDEEYMWWNYERIDILAQGIPAHYHIYLVAIPLQPRNELEEHADDMERDQFTVDIPFLDQGKLEEDQKSLCDLDFAHGLEIRIRKCQSDKTLRAEASSVNALNYPRIAEKSDCPVTERSSKAYNYLLNFRCPEDKEEIDILEELPGIRSVLGDTFTSLPQQVQAGWERLDHHQKEAIKKAPNAPQRVHIVPGVAGCGKTRVAEMCMIFSHFANPSNSKSTQAFKSLYIVNNNTALDMAAHRFQEAFDQMYESGGFKGPRPSVIRLYAVDTEVRDMKRRFSSAIPELFDSQAAEEALKKTTPIEVHFLSQLSLTRMTRDAHQLRISRSRKAKTLSLHEAAFKFYTDHKAEFGELSETMDELKATEGKDREVWIRFKALVKDLYKRTLMEHNGVICTTAVGCYNGLFRSTYKPKLVILDEAARMRELTTLIPIAWFAPALWLVLGDPFQLLPYITGEMHPEAQNPMLHQLQLSTMTRAVESGNIDSYLVINHRAKGGLHTLPSQLIYNDNMTVSVEGTAGMFPDSVKHFWAFIKTHINPIQPPNKLRVMLEFPGSKTTKQGDSTVNPAYVQHVLEKIVIPALRDKKLTQMVPHTDKPARILILALYKAQLYFTQTSWIRFTADLHRICLALTRSIQYEVAIMNRGMWLGNFDNPNLNPQATILCRIFNKLKSVNIRINYCPVCQTTQHTEFDAAGCCTSPGAKTNLCDCTGDPHPDLLCPTKSLCLHCGEVGHDTNLCEKDPAFCVYCHKDHLPSNCHKEPCALCKSKAHSAQNCVICVHCREKHEGKCDEAQLYKARRSICRECEMPGHMARNCSKDGDTRDCYKCGETGHIASDCPVEKLPKACRVCGEENHVARDCPQNDSRRRQLNCFECGATGHVKSQCPNTDEKKVQFLRNEAISARTFTGEPVVFGLTEEQQHLTNLIQSNSSTNEHTGDFGGDALQSGWVAESVSDNGDQVPASSGEDASGDSSGFDFEDSESYNAAQW